MLPGKMLPCISVAVQLVVTGFVWGTTATITTSAEKQYCGYNCVPIFKRRWCNYRRIANFVSDIYAHELVAMLSSEWHCHEQAYRHHQSRTTDSSS